MRVIAGGSALVTRIVVCCTWAWRELRSPKLMTMMVVVIVLVMVMVMMSCASIV